MDASVFREMRLGYLVLSFSRDEVTLNYVHKYCIINSGFYIFGLEINNSRRCKKYIRAGERKGSLETFVDNLPILPDNIRYDGEGLYWIGCPKIFGLYIIFSISNNHNYVGSTNNTMFQVFCPTP